MRLFYEILNKVDQLNKLAVKFDQCIYPHNFQHIRAYWTVKIKF